jgi:hypothetical protein
MPRARVMIAVSAKPGAFRNCRSASRISASMRSSGCCVSDVGYANSAAAVPLAAGSREPRRISSGVPKRENGNLESRNSAGSSNRWSFLHVGQSLRNGTNFGESDHAKYPVIYETTDGSEASKETWECANCVQIVVLRRQSGEVKCKDTTKRQARGLCRKGRFLLAQQ